MSTVPELSATTEGGVLTVTLHRPGRLNAITAELLAELDSLVGSAAGDPSVRVVVLRGTDRAFCSGADLASIDIAAGETVPVDTIVAANALIRTIQTLPVPVVAAARGVVAGIGVPLAIAADLVFADESGYLLLAFTRIGLMPDGGANALVAASIGRTRAMRMALLAEKLPAAEAYAAGLLSGVWPDESYEEELAKVVGQLVAGPTAAYARTKAAINAATLTSLEPAFAAELDGQAALLLAPDFHEGALAFIEKRRPTFTDRPQ